MSGTTTPQWSLGERAVWSAVVAGERGQSVNQKPSEVTPGGADRVAVGTDYSQLSHHALRLMAETQAEGNAKYGYGNWQKGLPLSNLISHAIEHILKFANGDLSENHLGHALWNLEKAAHFMVERPDLVDIKPLRKALNLDHQLDGCEGMNEREW